MTDPLFDSRTPRFDLPLLFAGQAQKEGYVNEVSARIDAILHGAIEDELTSPPATPGDGQCWLVGASASGEWSGKSGQIAARQAGNWLFITPCDGMRLLNRATGQEIRFNGSWLAAPRPSEPSGGSTVDAEARAAINAVIASLTTAGILAPG
ncbi:DUF2793 domain-containing protein [Novosphingobium sp.]|uniref:DUF2793 domain-containing protein n=1 Tax=Novosphingobium sp. TaxID=1874826 RepID=UPI0025F83716|nr:DUF2793 domain-containing protein [Novosphingobium sp.]MCC6926107.1 DUF2793 domain-containing protein [Novosphingobium sp.]